jgi:recombinational DNA repair ATPase RecF
MANVPYILDQLLLSGFRAFLGPQRFDFGTKRSLAVFAPNGSGKSSIIDALEFMFSKDGTLKRLGVRAINNQAGVAALAHNMADEKEISPRVEASFKLGNQKLVGSRSTLGDRKRPPVADSVRSCFSVTPLIRGHELRSFVEEQKAEKRYEDVAHWLQLDPLVAVQRNLRVLRRRTKAAAEERDALSRVDSQLKRKSANQVKAWDEKAVLAYANSILEPLDGQLSLNSLDRTDPAFITVQDRAKAEDTQLGLEGLRQVRRMAVVLYEQEKDPDTGGIATTGLIPKFETAIEARMTAKKTKAAERSAAANAVFAELWKAAEPLFAEGRPVLDKCPVCKTPIGDSAAGSVEGVRQHIAAHREELAGYAMAKKRFDDATTAVHKHHNQLLTALEALKPLLAAEYATLRVELAAYLDVARSWTVETVPDARKLASSLNELRASIDARISEIEAKKRESTYTKVVGKLEEMIELKDERERALCFLTELGKLAEALNAQAAFISRAIREEIQALLDTLKDPILSIYRQIQGAGAAPIRLELPSEDETNQQRLNLVIDFAKNRTGVQPSGYLSDSQIHSLALALRLAAIKRFNTAAPIIALDDVVTSYDADHRRTIAALLAKEFTDFQLIVTTHDERFFIYLKDQLGDKHWRYTRISRLDPDFGPRFLDHKVTEDMIEARWYQGKSAANEMRQAEEEWLLRLCRDFGVKVRIRSVERAYSYERSELAAALASCLHKLGHIPPVVPGVNNRFLASLQQGAIENFGSHFQDSPYGDGSTGDEQARWGEFKFFRDRFICSSCGGTRFKRPIGMNKMVCAKANCETRFGFIEPGLTAGQGA